MWRINKYLVTILVILAFIYYLRKKAKFNYWSTRNIPCEIPFPFLGNIPNILISRKTVPQYLADLYKKYEDHPYFGIFLLQQPALVLRDPELIKGVLIKNFAQFPNRSFTIDKEADPLTCSSVFAVKNPEWKPLRTKLSPIFTSGKMKLMLPLMKECCNSMTNYLEQNINGIIDMKDIAGKYTTDVIASCTFGVNSNCFVDENSEFRIVGKKLFSTSLLRKLSVFGYFLAPTLVKIFKFSFLDREATMYLHKLFWSILEDREKGQKKRNDLIDILIDLKNDKSDSTFKFDGVTVSSQAISFFSAGHETTSSTISFALYELAMHGDCQEKLRQEIKEAVSQYGDVTYEAIKDMQYLDMVISETLRKYTQAPFLIRECVEDCVMDSYKLRIDAGTHVIIPIAGLHADPQYYQNPKEFNPERFSEENRSHINPYTYLPFGGGPRNCIGERFALLSGKIGLAHIIKDFQVLKSPLTEDQLRFNHKSLLLEPEGGIPLILRKME